MFSFVVGYMIAFIVGYFLGRFLSPRPLNIFAKKIPENVDISEHERKSDIT